MPKENNHPDYILLATVTILLILGILILASVSASFSQERFGTTYYFLNHQLLFGLIPGLILGFVVFRIPLDSLKKIAPILLLINLVFMAMVFLPKIGTDFRGASRWVNLGPISFQPSEFLKITFILYLAAWLTNRTGKIGNRKPMEKENLLTFSIIVFIISLFLIFQPDISTLAVITISAGLMYFLANTPLWHSILIILIGIVGLLILIEIAPYRANRLAIFLHPELDPMGKGYQQKQALIAVGSGGIFGKGLGMSQQKFGFLPQSISDSIFAIFAEETGFIGSLILTILFFLFFWRGFKIGKEKEDKFLRQAALGITSWITLQAFINLGSMIGVLPLAGIPLPFVSYGGSALVSELVGVGILLNISKQ